MEIGDSIPSFSGITNKGENFSEKDCLGNYSVIYFYPKDNTPGCTAEACNFRDLYEDFTEQGAIVVGISNDGIESHQKFSKKHNLPFSLLTDINGKIAKQFGVKKKLFGLLNGRETFVFSPSGELIYKFGNMLDASGHVEKSLEAISKHKRGISSAG